MKKLITILGLLLLNITIFAQAPQKMTYQAVIRNSSNNLVASTTVGMRISILQGTSTGPAVYVETQTTTTNINGLATIEIGTGAASSGTFSAINWGGGPYFVKTETDPTGGTAYSIVGTSQLNSVPYALYAANVTNYVAGPGISVAGGTITNTAPNQTMALTASGNASVTGTYPNYTITSTRIVKGTTTGGFSPTIITGNGFTITSPANGIYDVVYTTPFPTIPTIVASPHFNNAGDGADGNNYHVKVYLKTTNGFRAIVQINQTGTIASVGFSFIAMGN